MLREWHACQQRKTYNHICGIDMFIFIIYIHMIYCAFVANHSFLARGGFLRMFTITTKTISTRCSSKYCFLLSRSFFIFEHFICFVCLNDVGYICMVSKIHRPKPWTRILVLIVLNKYVCFTKSNCFGSKESFTMDSHSSVLMVPKKVLPLNSSPTVMVPKKKIPLNPNPML